MNTVAPQSFDDVGELGAGQPGRCCGVDRAGVVAAPQHLEVARMVLHAQRDVIAGLHPGGPQHATQAVGGRVELGECRHRARAGHDHRRLVGRRFRRSRLGTSPRTYRSRRCRRRAVGSRAATRRGTVGRHDADRARAGYRRGGGPDEQRVAELVDDLLTRFPPARRHRPSSSASSSTGASPGCTFPSAMAASR